MALVCPALLGTRRQRRYAAIPPADSVYGAGATALWWVPVGGQPVRSGQVEADFFGLPTFSADGEWISDAAPLRTGSDGDHTDAGAQRRDRGLPPI